MRRRTRNPRKLTPAVVRTLVEWLSAPDATLADAAEAAGITWGTLARWIDLARRGHPQLAGLAKAAALRKRLTRLEREAAAANLATVASALVQRREALDAQVARERQAADSAAALLRDGASVREAARRLRLEYDTLRALVRRGRRTGAPHLRALVHAAAGRSRRDACPHCGQPMPRRRAA